MTDSFLLFWQKQKSREWAQLWHGNPETGDQESVVQEDEHAGGSQGLSDPTQHTAAETKSSSPEAGGEKAQGRIISRTRGSWVFQKEK